MEEKEKTEPTPVQEELVKKKETPITDKEKEQQKEALKPVPKKKAAPKKSAPKKAPAPTLKSAGDALNNIIYQTKSDSDLVADVRGYLFNSLKIKPKRQ